MRHPVHTLRVPALVLLAALVAFPAAAEKRFVDDEASKEKDEPTEWLKDYDKHLQQEDKVLTRVFGPRGSDIKGYGEAVDKRGALAVYAQLNRQYGGRMGDLRAYIMNLFLMPRSLNNWTMRQARPASCRVLSSAKQIRSTLAARAANSSTTASTLRVRYLPSMIFQQAQNVQR
mgnify:CR=1 FL=1